MDSECDKNAIILWDYLQIKNEPEIVDCMIVLGSNDDRVASYAGNLICSGLARTTIFTGSSGRNTNGLLKISEAEHFFKIAKKQGALKSRVLIENLATNTGENIEFSLRLLSENKISCGSFMLVQKNFMGRRALATFRIYEPHKKVVVCCPSLSYEEYPSEGISKDLMLNTLVADFDRILRYPRLGFQIEQKVPSTVMDAFRYMVKAGFTKQL